MREGMRALPRVIKKDANARLATFRIFIGKTATKHTQRVRTRCPRREVVPTNGATRFARSTFPTARHVGADLGQELAFAGEQALKLASAAARKLLTVRHKQSDEIAR